MNIEWTLCSERMPPDDLNYKIITFDDNGYCTDDGKCLNSIKEYCFEFGTIWTEFTREKWEFLNVR